MATMIIAGERYEMPIWLKARLLEVVESDVAGVLNVESGTERGKYYPVRHDGHSAISCPCKAIGECAHMQAATRYLISVEAPGVEITQDSPVHEEEYSEQTAQDVPVLMDKDGFYGRVWLDGSVQELTIYEIRERFPKFRKVEYDEFYSSNDKMDEWSLLTKEQQREAYRALYPDDFYFAA